MITIPSNQISDCDLNTVEFTLTFYNKALSGRQRKPQNDNFTLENDDANKKGKILFHLIPNARSCLMKTFIFKKSKTQTSRPFRQAFVKINVAKVGHKFIVRPNQSRGTQTQEEK